MKEENAKYEIEIANLENEVETCQSRGVFHADFNEWFDLPDDYTYAQEFWGELYYKSYGEMTFEDARAQCDADGASLPVPLSSFENDFYASFYPNGHVWLGMITSHDGTELSTTKAGFHIDILSSLSDWSISKERRFDAFYWLTVSFSKLEFENPSKLDGTPATFTNWGSYMFAENTPSTGDYAYIDNRNEASGIYEDMNYWNNIKNESDMANAICVFKIPSKFSPYRIYC